MPSIADFTVDTFLNTVNFDLKPSNTKSESELLPFKYASSTYYGLCFIDSDTGEAYKLPFTQQRVMTTRGLEQQLSISRSQLTYIGNIKEMLENGIF